MIWLSDEWKEYEVLDTSEGERLERWGKYLTKEPREKGRRYVGDRTWRTSIHMKKPEIISEFVEKDDNLLPPAGAFILDKTSCENCYGRFCHMMAMLPEQTK